MACWAVWLMAALLLPCYTTATLRASLNVLEAFSGLGCVAGSSTIMDNVTPLPHALPSWLILLCAGHIRVLLLACVFATTRGFFLKVYRRCGSRLLGPSSQALDSLKVKRSVLLFLLLCWPCRRARC